MKIASIVALLIAAIVFAYFLFFPKNTFMIFKRSSGGTITFSGTGIEFAPPPDHYATNGFDEIERYVARLLVPTNTFKFLHIFTPDGSRGFGLDAKDGTVRAGLTVEWRQEPEREAKIRSFFASRGIAPTEDYLAGNGGVPDATRILSYPIIGSSAEVTALTKCILQELCGVSPAEALDINFEE